MSTAVRTHSGDPIPTVKVRGEAVLGAEPDEAVMWITLIALDDDPGKAVADVTRRSQALIAVLDELGIPKPDRSTTGVSVGEEFDHTPTGRRSLGHRAAAGMSIRFKEPDLIGQLISRASDELQASILGPRWYISPTNPVRLQAARQAASEAKRKAEAYAGGVDAQLGDLLELSEPEGFAGIATARRGGLKPMSAGQTMPIEAGEHEVAAVIDATFVLKIT